jgi:hypothetical protein
MQMHRHHDWLSVLLCLLMIALIAGCSSAQPDADEAVPSLSTATRVPASEPTIESAVEVEEVMPIPEQPTIDLFALEPIKSTLDIGNGWFSRIELHDMNADGTLDLVAADFQDDLVRIYTNDGLGAFQSTVELPVDEGPSGLALADFDGDGRLDITVSHPETEDSGISLLFDDGSGHFNAPISVTTVENPTFLQPTDLEMDGDIDLIVNDFYSSEVHILRNDGAGNFSPDEPVVLTAGGQMVTEIIDLNDDTYPDAVVTHPLDAKISLLMNDGAGSLAKVSEYAVGTHPEWVAFGDLDRDTDLDMIVTSKTGTISILMNDGNGAFVEDETLEPGGILRYGLLADMNGDSRSDLLVANEGVFSVQAFANLGDGTFAHQTDYAAFPTAPRRLRLADIDSDGIDELMAASGTQLTIFDFAD